MPPAIGKSKPKGREGRQSRSRNTTPSSSVSAPLTSATPTMTALLEIPLSSLMVPTNISYDSVLDRHGGGGAGIPDATHLQTISADLKTLAQLASARSEANNKGMRDLSQRRKQVIEEEREREKEIEQIRLQEEEERRKSIKREDEDDEDNDVKMDLKPDKTKRKKEKSVPREERPLNHGAHGLARQDGLDLPLEGALQLFLKWSCQTESIIAS